MTTPRYTIRFCLVEVDDDGDEVDTVTEQTLEYATTDKEFMANVMSHCFIRASDAQGASGSPLVPAREDDDGESMLRRMEEAGGNRFATGLYGDVYGFGDDDARDDPNYGWREQDDDEDDEDDGPTDDGPADDVALVCPQCGTPRLYDAEDYKYDSPVCHACMNAGRGIVYLVPDVTKEQGR